MSTNKIKWAILGTSPISHTIAKAIQSSKTGTLVAVGSRSLQKARQFAETYGIAIYDDDYQQLLDDKDIDAIYIGLPNHLHHEWMLRAAAAKKHILCEKPFTLTADEAREAINAVQKNNVFCMEALMYRCHPFIKSLQNLIARKLIGDIKLYQAYYSAHITDVANPTAGGAIRNLGCYPLSLVRLLAHAEPVEIQSMGRVNSQNDNQASVMLKFPDESIAMISTADDLKMRWSFEIFGTKGSLKVTSNPWLPELDNTYTIQLDSDTEPHNISFTADTPLYTYQIDVAGNAILQGDYRNHEGMSLQDTLGNAIVLEEWVKQVHQPLTLSTAVRMTA